MIARWTLTVAALLGLKPPELPALPGVAHRVRTAADSVEDDADVAAPDRAPLPQSRGVNNAPPAHEG